MLQLCGSNEIGQFFSLLAVVEVLWAIVDSAIFTAVYTTTLDYYPSFEHLVAAAFGLCHLSGFLWLHWSLIRDQLAGHLPVAHSQGKSMTNTTENCSKAEDKHDTLSYKKEEHSFYEHSVETFSE